jgi:hydroxypyruvate isomerase
VAVGGGSHCDAGYTGYFAHEFIPTHDPMTSLAEAARLCDA